MIWFLFLRTYLSWLISETEGRGDTLILSMEYKPDFLLYVCVKRICKTWISLVSGWQGSCQYEEWTAGKRASSAVLEINDNEAEFDELVVFPSPRSSMVWGRVLCHGISFTASPRMSCQGQSALQMGKEGHKMRWLEELTSWKWWKGVMCGILG